MAGDDEVEVVVADVDTDVRDDVGATDDDEVSLALLAVAVLLVKPKLSFAEPEIGKCRSDALLEFLQNKKQKKIVNFNHRL